MSRGPPSRSLISWSSRDRNMSRIFTLSSKLSRMCSTTDHPAFVVLCESRDRAASQIRHGHTIMRRPGRRTKVAVGVNNHDNRFRSRHRVLQSESGLVIPFVIRMWCGRGSPPFLQQFFFFATPPPKCLEERLARLMTGTIGKTRPWARECVFIEVGSQAPIKRRH